MSKYRICDVMVELAELGTELLQEIRQELQYMRLLSGSMTALND